VLSDILLACPAVIILIVFMIIPFKLINK